MRIVEFEAAGAPVRGYLHECHDRLAAHAVRPALIVCAGGCYRFRSPREEDPPALAFFSAGYNVFLLGYAVGVDARNFKPMRQLAEAVHHIRGQAAVWHICPDEVAALGFSAGGHLAASLCVLWNRADLGLNLPEDCRPDALILGYPVITMYEYAHEESRDNVTGGDPGMREIFSLERQAGAQMPPVFVWHTVDDPSVPVENTLLLVEAMQKAGVPYECHLFAHGDHGLSLANQEVETPNPACAVWIRLARTWLDSRFHYVP